ADAAFKVVTRQQKAILCGSLDGVAERPNAARNDRDLVDRIDARQGRGHQRVAHLVIGDAAALLRAEDAALLLVAGRHAFNYRGEVIERHRVAVAPRRHNGGLVDEVGEVGAGEAGCQPGDLVEIDVRGKLHLGDMHLQDFQPSGAVGAVDYHLTVEPSGTQQGRIKHLRAIGGGEQDHARARIKAVELGEQLVERLLLLVIAAERAGYAAAPQRVELIDEDDTGRRSPRLLEKVADPRGPDADEHLDKLRAGYREKGYSRLAGDRARQQRLSGAWRPDQQHALGDARAKAPERFRAAQEGHALLELVFRLSDASDVPKCPLGVGFNITLGARFSDRHQTAETLPLCHAADAVSPDQVEEEDRQHPGQDCREKVVRRRTRDLDAMRTQLVGKRGIDAHGVEKLSPIGKRLLQRAPDGVGPDRRLGDLVLREQLLELAVGDGFDLRELKPQVLDQQHAEKSREEIPRGELLLALLGFLGRAVLRCRIRAAAIEAQEMQ